MTIDEALAAAAEHHQSGRLSEAAALHELAHAADGGRI